MTIEEMNNIVNKEPMSMSELAKKYALDLNLQFFASNDDDDDPADDPKDNDPKDDDDPKDTDDPKDNDPKDKDPKDNEKKFSQKELDDLVKERLKRAEIDKQNAIDEAKKLAKMNADEKREYEFEKMQRENEEYKAKINRYELGKEATEMLVSKGIVANDEILNFIVRDDAEQTSEAVKAFSKLVEKIADERMTEKLRGTPPKRTKSNNQGVSKDEIFKIKDSTKRLQAIKDNPHLF